MQTKSNTFSRSAVSMPQNNSKIEERLKALEEKAHVPCNGKSSVDADRVSALEKKLEQVISVLKAAAPGAAKNL